MPHSLPVMILRRIWASYLWYTLEWTHLKWCFFFPQNNASLIKVIGKSILMCLKSLIKYEGTFIMSFIVLTTRLVSGSSHHVDVETIKRIGINFLSLLNARYVANIGNLNPQVQLFTLVHYRFEYKEAVDATTYGVYLEANKPKVTNYMYV